MNSDKIRNHLKIILTKMNKASTIQMDIRQQTTGDMVNGGRMSK